MPGRPARALIGRSLVLLLRKGEIKHLFDLVQTLLRLAAGTADNKTTIIEREKEYRVSAAWCLGEVWSEFGNQVQSCPFGQSRAAG